MQLESSDCCSINLKLLATYLSPITMRMVFIAMAQSIYSYGIGSWAGAYNIHLNSLETIVQITLPIKILVLALQLIKIQRTNHLENTSKTSSSTKVIFF